MIRISALSARHWLINLAVLMLFVLLLSNCSLFKKPVGDHYQHLNDLSWMIGEWTDTTEDGQTIKSVCRWTKNKNFITRTFKVQEGDEFNYQGTEIIGWDPAEKVIRSWTFDSQGGYAGGIWIYEDNEWSSVITDEILPPDEAVLQKFNSRLDWLIGSWIDDGGEGRVETTCSWPDGKSFLSMQFTSYTEGKPDLEGLVILGWDDQQENIHSWIFDTDGGLAEGTGYIQDGAWQMRNRYVLPDGRLASAVTIYRKIDENNFAWRRIAQEVDGEMLPDMDAVVVTRQTTGDSK